MWNQYADKLPRLGLNLGCGPLMLDEVDGIQFVNIDKEPNNYKYAEGHRFILHDLTRPLLYDEETVEFINISQTLEHLNIRDGKALLQQCLGILKPNGTLRVTVPDAELLIQKMINEEMDDFKDVQPWPYSEVRSQMLKLGMILFGSMHEHGESGHRQCYDFEGLREILIMAGFRPDKIVRAEFDKRYDAEMAENHQLAVVATK